MVQTPRGHNGGMIHTVTGPAPGSTCPEDPVWTAAPEGFHRSEVSVIIGQGESVWTRAAADVLCWRVKTASGFQVDVVGRVTAGDEVRVTAKPLGVRVVEPVCVLTVVDGPDRVGFAYGTLPGHPIAGEEAFIVHRDGGHTHLTVRSLTQRAQEQPWRSLFPLLRVAQRFAHARYLRALS